MNKRKRIKEVLDKVGIKNHTVLVETPDQHGKPHIELRNYHKIALKFLMALPDRMMETELNILLHKHEKGELFNDPNQV